MQLLRTTVPKHDENLMSYLLRLAELNGYESLHLILRLAETNSLTNKNCSVIFKSHESLGSLAYLIRRDVRELIPLTYSPVENWSLGLQLFNGSPVQKYVLRPGHPKLCPHCLRESAHHRRIWDLSLVTVCLRHKCLLIDECPGCRAPLNWLREQMSSCVCGYDLREAQPNTVPEAELRLTEHLHHLCGVMGRMTYITVPQHKDPAFKLNLRDFISLLVFIARHCQGITTVTGKQLVQAIKIHDLHQLFMQSYASLEDWPTRYYTFLDWWQQQRGRVFSSHQQLAVGLTKDFGGFYTGLHTSLSEKQFEFMRTAFKKYLKERFQGLHISAIVEHAREQTHSDCGRYITKSEAMTRLGISDSYLRYLIEGGHLKQKPIKRGKRKIYVLQLASVNRLATDFDESIRSSEAAVRLGVGQQTVMILVNQKYLRVVLNPYEHGCIDWRICPLSVNELLSQIRKRVCVIQHPHDMDMLSYKATTINLRGWGIRASQFVLDILEGRIVSYAENSDEVQVYKLMFERAAIKDYVKSMVKDGARWPKLRTTSNY